MKRLIIIGAGGFGREVLAWARQCSEYRKGWEIAGFLDDKPEVLEGIDVGIPILGSVGDWNVSAGELFICTVASPSHKRRCTELIESRGGVFTKLIHPSVIMGERIDLGDGVILCPSSTLTCDIRIGRHCSLNVHTSIGHDVSVSDYCHLNAFAEVCGWGQLGESVLMGTHSSVLQRCRVGANAVLGPGCITFSDVPEACTMMGVPAKPLRELR